MYTDLKQEVKDAIDNGTPYKCLVFVSGGNFPISTTRCLTEANIAEGGFEIERGCTATDRLSFGDVISGVFTLRLIKKAIADFDVNWGSVHLYPFVYPAYVNGEEVSFTAPKLIETDTQAEANKPCIWGGKDVSTTRKYGRVYTKNSNNNVVAHNLDQYIIPFQPFIVANVKEDLHYIELTAYDICDTFDSNFVIAEIMKTGGEYVYFETPNISEERSIFYQLQAQSGVELPKDGLGYGAYYYTDPQRYSPAINKGSLTKPLSSYTMRDMIGYMAQTAGSNIISDRKYMKTIAVSWNHDIVGRYSTDTVHTYRVSKNKRNSFSSSARSYQVSNYFWSLRKRNVDESGIGTVSDKPYVIGFYANDFLSSLIGSMDIYYNLGWSETIPFMRTVMAGFTNQMFHRPFTASVLGNPCIDPSDRAIIDDVSSTDPEENTINTPITTVTFRLNGNTYISCCNGAEPTSDSYIPSTTVQQSTAFNQAANEAIQANKIYGSVSSTTVTFADYEKYSIYLVGFKYSYNGILQTEGNILCHKETGLNGVVHIRGSVVHPWTGTSDKQQYYLFDSHIQGSVDLSTGVFTVDTAVRIAGANTYPITITSITGVI